MLPGKLFCHRWISERNMALKKCPESRIWVRLEGENPN